MTNLENPNNFEELNHILSNATTEELSKNLSDIIRSYKESNILKNKKLLKFVFDYVLDYVIYKLNPTETYRYLNFMIQNILELSYLFPNEFNGFIKKVLFELDAYILQKNFEEVFPKEKQLINFSLMISFLTFKLGQPNQLLSNFITLLNIYIKNLRTDFHENFSNFIKKIFYLGVLEILSQNVNSFNPILFNEIEYVLHEILEYFRNKSETEFSNNELNLEIFNLANFTLLSCLNNSKNFNFDETNKIFLSIYLKVTKIILSIINNNKDNLSFDALFKKIFMYVKEIEKYVEAFTLIRENSIIIRNKIEQNKFKILQKKNIQLNFMIIKKKPLVSLEPDYDRSFLGSIGDYKPNNEKMAKIMKKKIKNTKKQAIRNLKKEAKVIDVARQKRNKNIYDKKKQELKISNQFVEQQKIDDKKLMTSQSKKRFKLKNKRGKI